MTNEKLENWPFLKFDETIGEMNPNNSIKLINVLGAIEKKLIEECNGIYIRPSLIYCNSCNELRVARGDYRISTGTDCYGEHYETLKSPMECDYCHKKSLLKFLQPIFLD